MLPLFAGRDNLEAEQEILTKEKGGKSAVVATNKRKVI